jgi:hypothetical protein
MIFEMDPDESCCKAAAALEISPFQNHCQAAEFLDEPNVFLK